MVKNNEDLVQKFLSFPPENPVTDGEYDKALRHMVNYMTQLSPSKLVAGTGTIDGDDFLEVCIVFQNSSLRPFTWLISFR